MKAMKTEYSIQELFDLQLEGLPTAISGWRFKTKKENWSFRLVDGKGGKGGKKKLFTPPQYVLDAIQAQKAQQLLEKTKCDPLPAISNEIVDLTIQRDAISKKQFLVESCRIGVLRYIENLMTMTGVCKEKAISTALTQARLPGFEQLSKAFELAVDKRGTGLETKIPSVRTIKRWFAMRDERGLVPQKVKKQDFPPWWEIFLRFYQRPQNPDVTLAYEMFCAFVGEPMNNGVHSIHKCYYWLERMGTVERQRGRMGSKEIKNILPFHRRDIQNLQPCEVYAADGHTFDAEVRHPQSGKAFRPEITAIIDVATRKLVGWSIDLNESALAVLGAIVNACESNGIASIFYTDNGKGYINKLMTAEGTGLLQRLGMSLETALPYNSRAKGVIERSHRSIWIKAAQMLATYVGEKMDDQAKQLNYKSTRQIGKKTVKVRLLEWKEFMQYCAWHVEQYNNRPHSSLPKIVDACGVRRNMTPNELWNSKVAAGAQILQVEEADKAYLWRPQITRTVRNCEIVLFENRYYDRGLTQYHGKQVKIGYDVHDANLIWVYDEEDRFILKAEWNANSSDFFAKSVVQQAKENAVKQAVKRKNQQIDRILEQMPVALIEAQETINLGSKVINLAELSKREKLQTAPVKQNLQVQGSVAIAPSYEQVADHVTQWQTIMPAQERFALYQQFKALPQRSVELERCLAMYEDTPAYKSRINEQF